MKKLKVLFIAAELNPLAKVGGLGDVTGALPKALRTEGIDVRIVIPKYGSIDDKKYPSKKIADNVTVPFNNKKESIALYETPLPGSEVPVYLIDNLTYLGQNGIYFETAELSDNKNREAERFTFLARSSLSIFGALNWFPDVIHCHDWHAGMAPVLVKTLAKTNPLLKKIKTLLTIHNLEYQGWYNAETVLDALGIAEKDHPALSQQKKGYLSSVRQGILTSDHLNTVSETYAKEILTKEFGNGLEDDLIARADRLTGIVNGIDVDRFNPETDSHIAAQYSLTNIEGKKKCKAALQKKCELEVNETLPIFGIVSRLVGQKGLDLIYKIADQMMNEDLQFVLLGTGDPKLEKLMQKIAITYPRKASVRIEFDTAFAQQIYAGSDVFLMPSRFEPCGLGQMISMRYGTLPIVRATGGLKDTVQDYSSADNSGDGFVFDAYESKELLKAIQRALKLFQNQESWYTVVRRVMQKDFSWNASAKKYIKLYHQLKQ